MIAVVDLGIGNLGSIVNMIRKIGREANVVSGSDSLEGAHKIIIPGVGSFDRGMEALQSRGFLNALNRLVLERRVPILGICLGMQLMMEGSEEGKSKGLGWIEGGTARFKFDASQSHLRIPHMGWNTVRSSGPCKLIDDLEDNPRFYFTHSYHVVLKRKEDQLFTTHYGYDFVSGFQKNNIFGVQFHPEKSHKFGMQLMRTFLERF